MKIIIIAGVVLAICVAVFIIDEEMKYRRYTEKRKKMQEHAAFEKSVQEIANQMVKDMRAGCVVKGCCIYDAAAAENSNEGMCYCKFLGKKVKRQSSCEYFTERKA